MLRAARRTDPASSRLLLEEDLDPPVDAAPPSPPGGGAWKDWWEGIKDGLKEEGYSDWEIVGIVLASIVAFFVALCIIFIFLGAIQHCQRRNARTKKAKGEEGGVNGVGGEEQESWEQENSAAVSSSRTGRVDKNK